MGERWPPGVSDRRRIWLGSCPSVPSQAAIIAASGPGSLLARRRKPKGRRSRTGICFAGFSRAWTSRAWLDSTDRWSAGLALCVRVAFGVQCGHAAEVSRDDRLALVMVGHVASGEQAFHRCLGGVAALTGAGFKEAVAHGQPVAGGNGLQAVEEAQEGHGGKDRAGGSRTVMAEPDWSVPAGDEENLNSPYVCALCRIAGAGIGSVAGRCIGGAHPSTWREQQ